MTPVLCGCETFKIIDVVISPVVVFMVDVMWLIPLTQVALDVVCREVGRVRSPGLTPDG